MLFLPLLLSYMVVVYAVDYYRVPRLYQLSMCSVILVMQQRPKRRRGPADWGMKRRVVLEGSIIPVVVLGLLLCLLSLYYHLISSQHPRSFRLWMTMKQTIWHLKKTKKIGEGD